MQIIFVHINVKSEFMEEFKFETLINAKSSLLEKGVQRFDFFQEKDDPSKFLLIEVYKNNDAPLKHKETNHYLKWKSAVEKMMAEPRRGIKYENIYSGDKMWGVNLNEF